MYISEIFYQIYRKAIAIYEFKHMYSYLDAFLHVYITQQYSTCSKFLHYCYIVSAIEKCKVRE